MAQISYRPQISDNQIKVYRWYYLFALAQLILYFVVPMIIFPGQVIKDIQVISSLTLGPLVGLFFGLVSLTGLFLDRTRRPLYLVSLAVIVLYLAGVILSWAYIEQLDFLLR